MKQLNKLDRAAAKSVTAALREAVQGAVAGSGMDIGKVRTTYSESTITFKVELVLGSREDHEANEFRRLWPLYVTDGVTPDDYGREVLHRARTFRLTGYNERAPKFPFIVRDPDTNKGYRMTARDVQNGLRLAAEAKARYGLERERQPAGSMTPSSPSTRNRS